MSGAVISSNTSLKVNRAISGATTVNANSYAIVTYSAGAAPSVGAANTQNPHNTSPQAEISERYFGPGQSIPATFTTTFSYYSGANAYTTASITWTLLSGVEFINSP